MCGIYGSTKLYPNEVVARKLSLMKFRGPDHQHFLRVKKLNGEEVTLGHVRLAIMDLDARSNQPFCYNENITIVFNGEVYNYRELAQRYLSGLDLRTESDTEVICAMYERFGKDCVNYFNGMFAYVIFDKAKNVLVGARDRLGKKPFYYYLTRDSFEFASQLNPIRYGNNFHISELSRKLYLLNGYISDPYSIYTEVSKLRAGQLFTLDLSTYKMEVEQYWDIDSNSCGFTTPKSYNEAKDQLRELLFDAVRIRLNADVPVGMFLSGGIDSSLVSAIVSQLNKDICAYTIGFNNPKYNESNHANDVAQHLGIPIKINFCEGDDMLDIVKDIPTYFDEPFADFSLIPTSLLCQKTRQDVTVALGGDGGDETFFGYSSYFKLKQKDMLCKILPYPVRYAAYLALYTWRNTQFIDMLRYHKVEDIHTGRYSYGTFADAATFDPYILSRNLPDLKYLDTTKRGYLAYADYDMKHYMNSCINTKADRAAMRSSLELRSPIMDYRVTEFSKVLPIDYLYSKDIGGKRILKDILYEMVPREILDRPKQGFAAPVGDWFKTNLKKNFVDIIDKSLIYEYLPELDPNKIILYREKFLANSISPISDTSFLKIFNYLSWIKYQIIEKQA